MEKPQQFTKDFNLFIKQCYDIVWSADKKKESRNLMIVKTNTGKPMLLSKCAVFDRKMFRFIKEQEASTLLSTLGLKAPLSKIPVFGDNLF